MFVLLIYCDINGMFGGFGMKKMILGCALIICATICFCTLILCSFIICSGEGKQMWSFSQFGFSSVIQDLSWLAVAVPIIFFVAE